MLVRNSSEAQKAAHGPEDEGGWVCAVCEGGAGARQAPLRGAGPVSPAGSQALGLKPFVLGRSRTFGLSRLCCPGETPRPGQPHRRRVISQRLGFTGGSGGAGGHTEHPPRLRGWGRGLRALRQLSRSSIQLLAVLELPSPTCGLETFPVKEDAGRSHGILALNVKSIEMPEKPRVLLPSCGEPAPFQRAGNTPGLPGPSRSSGAALARSQQLLLNPSALRGRGFSFRKGVWSKPSRRRARGWRWRGAGGCRRSSGLAASAGTRGLPRRCAAPSSPGLAAGEAAPCLSFPAARCQAEGCTPCPGTAGCPRCSPRRREGALAAPHSPGEAA